MQNFPLSHQRREQARSKAFCVSPTEKRKSKTKDKTVSLAPLKSFVVDRSATNVENSVYPPPNKQNKTEHHTVFVGPTKDQVVFSQEKQRLFVSQHKGLTQTRTKTRGQSRRNFGLIFLYFLTLALFSDGKIRQQKPLFQKEGRKFKT